MRQSVRKKEGPIEKLEDKAWRAWYEGLSKKDHEQYHAKLGLTEADEEELEEVRKELKQAKTNPKTKTTKTSNLD